MQFRIAVLSPLINTPTMYMRMISRFSTIILPGVKRQKAESQSIMTPVPAVQLCRLIPCAVMVMVCVESVVQSSTNWLVNDAPSLYRYTTSLWFSLTRSLSWFSHALNVAYFLFRTYDAPEAAAVAGFVSTIRVSEVTESTV